MYDFITWYLAGDVRASYIRRMDEAITRKIYSLSADVRRAQEVFFASRDPGNLSPAQKQAFHYRDTAKLLLFKAAQLELDAELELQKLLAMESQ